MPRRSPHQELLRSLAHGHYRMRASPSIEALGDGDCFTGRYLSGQHLSRALEQLYEDVIGPINRARRDRLRQLDGPLHGDELVTALVAAVCEPLVEACRAEEGELVPFCYRAILRTGVQLPLALWWSRFLGEALRRQLPEQHGQGDGRDWVPNIVNKSLYLYLADNTEGFAFPLRGADEECFRTEIGAIVRALLGIRSC